MKRTTPAAQRPDYVCTRTSRTRRTYVFNRNVVWQSTAAANVPLPMGCQGILDPRMCLLMTRRDPNSKMESITHLAWFRQGCTSSPSECVRAARIRTLKSQAPAQPDKVPTPCRASDLTSRTGKNNDTEWRRGGALFLVSREFDDVDAAATDCGRGGMYTFGVRTAIANVASLLRPSPCAIAR